ncbi:unnamed protein product [Nippostrongylus brasiliensis]|uniref:Uncharacterized protein n=1 Tax=Nippostrongylus brasiliensis TaxID=27835 RepID=A0A0N4YRE3_NIPBR|nr:unnamed protein product [Nippostrongylus brasiliensis]
MRLLSAFPYRLLSSVQKSSPRKFAVRLQSAAAAAVKKDSGPVDERECKEIYTTCPIDLSEPKFEKILIANREVNVLDVMCAVNN